AARPSLALAAFRAAGVPTYRQRLRPARRRPPDSRTEVGIQQREGVRPQSTAYPLGMFAVPSCWPPRGRFPCPTARIEVDRETVSWDSVKTTDLPANSGDGARKGGKNTHVRPVGSAGARTLLHPVG